MPPYSWATSEKSFTASTVIFATVLFGSLPSLATSSFCIAVRLLIRQNN